MIFAAFAKIETTESEEFIIEKIRKTLKFP